MKRIKYDNIFLLLSYLFIFCCCIFYGSRLIYFYRIENPKLEKQELLFDTIIQDKNLKIKDDNYTFVGMPNNNYLEYSGRLFRIVSITKEGYAKIITEENQTSLVFGYNQKYENSYIRSWLNDNDNEYKSFLDSLHNKDGLLVDTKTYIDILEEEESSNKNCIKDLSGLLSVYEYNQAGGKESYLNNGTSFWTSNNDEYNNTYYIYKTGSIVKDEKQLIGVRPIITINIKISNYEGSGTLNEPYKLIFKKGNLLKDKYVGEYIKLENNKYKIIETDDNYIKVASELMDEIEFGQSSYFSDEYGIGKYLNEELYNSLQYKDKILLGSFNTGKYDNTNLYNFNNQASYKEKVYISLLSIGELFIEDYENYYLLSRPLTTLNEVYEVKSDGLITNTNIDEKSNIRYTFHIDSNLKTNSGDGSFDNPYIVG